MISKFKGWQEVSSRLVRYADAPEQFGRTYLLNDGQRAGLRGIAKRITDHGLIVADEVGMGKTCIAVEVARAVIESGGRVAVLVPPGLGYQWHDELRTGEVKAPPLLRSLHQFLAAWKSDPSGNHNPWFRQQVVVLSHAFTNWRLGENSDTWRWSLLPELYAAWRKRTTGRLPKGYRNRKELTASLVKNAAKSICEAIPKDASHQAAQLALQLSRETPWPGALEAGEYRRDEDLRPWLECSVGLGLGIFDLVIIDEAHKSRGEGSGLSGLLDKVVLSAPHGRRLAMTATPVELDVDQWKQTLGRIRCPDFSGIDDAIKGYAEAVQRVRRSPSTLEAREGYRKSSALFQGVLSPYLLRRDKREDPAVQLFTKHSGRHGGAYRCESDLAVETSSLEPVWKRAVCAAESLSLITSLAENSVAKRLRLTLGNGHGISALIDQTRHSEKDRHQEEHDQLSASASETPCETPDSKREARTKWWLKVMKSPFADGDEALFSHPAIGAAVAAVERVTAQGGKVLVFGRFTKPMRALTDLLNAREMLRSLAEGRPWPQSKVHVGGDDSEWPAVRAAHGQLGCAIPLDQIDQLLKEQYQELEKSRKEQRLNLVADIEKGLSKTEPDARSIRLFVAFKDSVTSAVDSDLKVNPLSLVSSALTQLMGERLEATEESVLAEAFVQLLNALSDRDEGDQDGDGELSAEEADDLWPTLLERLQEEYTRSQGGFARLMYGGTKLESRRMIQLAFNRAQVNPKVLVAQSMVGREGLNLHRACRTVVLLHPEWNPGVTEQQIGRVDRVGSDWATALVKAVNAGCPSDELPRIDVHPVIFKGTYDEHNWSILRKRWDDLRAQLNGIVIPSRLLADDESLRLLCTEIALAAPNFSPLNTKV